MITSSNRLQPALQNLLQRVVRFYHPRLLCPTHISEDVCGGRKSLIKPVTRQNISNCSVLSSEIVMSVDVQRITLNALFMTISGERTEQLDIFCRITGITSDFLSFTDVELIRFFHGALQLWLKILTQFKKLMRNSFSCYSYTMSWSFSAKILSCNLYSNIWLIFF